MKNVTTDRQSVHQVMRLALERLHPEDELAVRIRDALEWAEREPLLKEDGDLDDLDGRYISTHPVIAVFQSAAETNKTPDFEALLAEAAQPTTSDGARAKRQSKAGRYLDYVNDWVRGRIIRPDAIFRWNLKRREYKHQIADVARIAVVGDWGTGFHGAWKVAMEIRELDPDHVIHLGDVYPSGQKEDIDDKFIEVWNSLNFEDTSFWALNGNHEMISGGHDYLEYLVGSFCRHQKASYFVLENAHWRFIGFDTAYVNHGLQRRGQDAMIKAMLADGTQSKILLSHHQPYSWFDKRPNARGGLLGFGDRRNLRETMMGIYDEVRPVNPNGMPHAWYWGHEHGCVIYDEDESGVRGRCIGHGGKDVRLNYHKGVRASNSESPPIKTEDGRRLLWDVERPGQEGVPREDRFAKNGFVFFELNGPAASVRYLDEDGDVWWDEVWQNELPTRSATLTAHTK